MDIENYPYNTPYRPRPPRQLTELEIQARHEAFQRFIAWLGGGAVAFCIWMFAPADALFQGDRSKYITAFSALFVVPGLWVLRAHEKMDKRWFVFAFCCGALTALMVVSLLNQDTVDYLRSEGVYGSVKKGGR